MLHPFQRDELKVRFVRRKVSKWRMHNNKVPAFVAGAC
jgi:hypothetical protein